MPKAYFNYICFLTKSFSFVHILQQLAEEKISPEVLLAHPKAKEWIVSMAKANYQELAKLASEFPDLVKLQVCNH